MIRRDYLLRTTASLSFTGHRVVPLQLWAWAEIQGALSVEAQDRATPGRE
jgi:hypothetical protein